MSKYLLRAVLVSLIELFAHLLSKDSLALFAAQDHFMGELKLMVLSFSVALRAVEPFLAARGSDGDLGVHNVFAHIV